MSNNNQKELQYELSEHLEKISTYVICASVNIIPILNITWTIKISRTAVLNGNGKLLSERVSFQI